MSSPASEPQVPGAGLRYPVPKTVARAKSKRGFGCEIPGTDSVVVAMRLLEIEDDGLSIASGGSFFVEDRIGNDVLFAGPVSEVQVAAACTAEGEIGVRLGVGRFLADGAGVFHWSAVFYHLEGNYDKYKQQLAPGQRRTLGRAGFRPMNLKAYPMTRRGAPVAIRVSFSVGGGTGRRESSPREGRGRISVTRPIRS